MIDVKGLLDELGIDYKESGKNVGPNDINISCPFCDSDMHLGISLKSGVTNCWVCSFEDVERRPSLLRILTEVTDMRWPEVKEKMKDWGFEFSYDAPAYTEDGLAAKCKLPREACKFNIDTPPRRKAEKYLKERGFCKRVINMYQLEFAVDGLYHNRIIIPIRLNGKLVSFVGRDFTDKQGDRYKNAPLHLSSERIKNLLYNYDYIKGLEHAYLLEGPSDVWSMGEDSMAVFKSTLSSVQRNLIIKLQLKSLTIIYDPMATARAYSAADDLLTSIPTIKVIRLDGIKDVAERDRGEILEIESKTPIYRG